jgi:hypothetical protein
MYYILNLDHDGYDQGVYNAFNTKEEAKAHLDNQEHTIRVGRIVYYTFLDKKVLSKVLSNIIFKSSATDVVCHKTGGYDAEEESVFHKDIQTILNFVRKYKDIISDDLF